MKPIGSFILTGILLASSGLLMAEGCCNTTSSCNVDCDSNNTINHVTTCYLPRSQSRNTVQKLVGLDPYNEHIPYEKTNYGTFNIGVEYSQSFNNKNIARCLFGPAAVSPASVSTSSSSTSTSSCSSDCDDSVMLRVAGPSSPITPNGTSDLDAVNFFLPGDFLSTITVAPKISNVNVPMQFFVGLNDWAEGLYIRVYAPVTYTRWQLNAQETVINPGTAIWNAGFINPEPVGPANLYTSFLSYTSGESITLPTSTPSVKVDPLTRQKIFNGCQTLTKTGLADLRAELGWDFILDDCYHLGLNVQVAAPTGNACSECFLFGPIVGNGKHWEVGGGATGHYTFWQSECQEHSLGLYVDADITHLCSRSEDRVFDLVDKPLSRYIIVQKMTKADPNLTVNNGATTPNLQFANEYTPLANVAIQNVNISYDVQGDVVAKFVYSYRGFDWELGYNFWGRSCIRIEPNCDCGPDFQENIWALKGSAQVFGFDNSNTARAIPATMNQTNAFVFPAAGSQNANVDNPTTLPTEYNGQTLKTAPTTSPGLGASYPAVTIQTRDLDFNSGDRGISHKVFTHLNYSWTDCGDWIPYIGIGASGEFGYAKEHGPRSGNNPSSDPAVVTSPCDECSRCPDCSLSQWSVWIKGGLTFN